MKFKPFSKKQLKVLSWWKFLMWAMENFSDCNFAICGKTVGSCRRNVIKPLINMMSGRYNIKDKRSENLLTVSKKGKTNTFYIFGGKDESSQDLIQGVTLAGVLFDEVALMPRSFVEQALARCSVEGARFWFNCNPDNPNHWFYREWVLKAPEKHALRLKFLMDDNLSLSDKVKQRYYSRRFILGEWVIAEGLVYQDYNDHIKEKLWNGNPDELVGRWYISMDYGTINPCSMGLWCVTDNEAVRVDEYYYNSRKEGYQRTDEEHYAELEKLAGDRYMERVIIDPSAASFKATIKKHGKFFVKSAKNDVINGIRTTSQMLTDGRIKIGVKCKASQEEFGMYRWDDKAEVDKVVKENDHAMDDIRYFAYTVLKREFKYKEVSS